jgi:hypothetical protein
MCNQLRKKQIKRCNQWKKKKKEKKNIDAETPIENKVATAQLPA